MTVICEIDTTLVGYDVSIDDAEFKLYLKYTAGTESPILGPSILEWRTTNEARRQ